MKFLYSLGIYAYKLGVRFAGISNKKAASLLKGHKDIFRTLKENISDSDKVIWFHAASLGEFEQGRPLIEKIRKERPGYKILLTFFSPSGYEVRKNYKGADCICYLPFDTPGAVKNFLDLAHPEMAIFVKYEFWRNYLQELNRRGVRTYLISGIFRPNQIFFRPWGKWYARWLSWFDKIYVQDPGSLRLLEKIGIDDAMAAGDTRFDRVAEIRDSFKKIPWLEQFTMRRPEGDDKGLLPGAPFVLMAGSSWPEDEKIYSAWIDSHPEVKLVIAPHEFDRERLMALRAGFAGNVVLLSEAKTDPEIMRGAQVLVIDCFGLLSSAYAYCDVAYVGGGFGAGLHNINEAATFGVPVIYGPNNKKFIEAQELATLGGGIEVDSAASFERIADRLLHDPADLRTRGRWAAEYISEKQGATEKIFSDIFK